MTAIYHQPVSKTDIHIRIKAQLRDELVVAKINMSAVCRKALKDALQEHQARQEQKLK